MSLPFELRALAAIKSDVFAAMERILAEEIARVGRRLAGIVGAETCSVSCPHFHTLANRISVQLKGR
jgi:hypothetical protein